MTADHNQEQHSTEQEPATSRGKLPFLRMIQSVFAAIFGIQSEKNRQQDFKKGDPAQYITLGIVAAVGIVLVMILVVNSVLSSAGG
jgi:hypothetical protein